MHKTTVPRLLASLAVTVAVACASPQGPQALPPQTMAPEPPEMGEPVTNAAESLEPTIVDPQNAPPAPEPALEIVEEPATTAESEQAPIESDALTVVLDAGAEEGGAQPRSLFEASQAEKERREEVGESTIVLTNKNLKEYSKGQLTFVEGAAESTGEDAAEATETSTEEVSDAVAEEDYWRNRVLDVRLGWRESLDRIEELEVEIARLRREFYAEDDPFYRDGQIKPAWDQALIELDEARRAAQRSQQELEETIDEGRRAGALPGWLREGIELEPTEEELEESLSQGDERVHEPSEPVIVEDGDGGGDRP